MTTQAERDSEDRGLRRKLWSIGIVILAGLLLVGWFAGRSSARDQSSTEDRLFGDAETRFAVYVHARPSTPLFDSVPESRRERLRTALVDFYNAENFLPLWTTTKRSRLRANEVVAVLARASEHGIDPERYDVTSLKTRFLEWKELDENGRFGLELDLSLALLLYGSHLLEGVIAPAGLDEDWHVVPREEDLAAVLAETLDSGPQALEELAPKHPEYAELQDMLGRYREIAGQGGWNSVPDGESVEAGDPIAPGRLRLLVQRLAVEGDLADDEADAVLRGIVEGPSEGAAVLEASVVEALTRFQERHGLEPDGKLGPETVGALNVPVERRIEQIELNLERWRWLPDASEGRHIRVNIADFKLHAFDGTEEQLEMKVAVGRSDWKTPVFADEMSHLEVNPYWNVPESILLDEVAPAQADDPGHLATKGMELLDMETGEVVDPGKVDWSRAGSDQFRYRVRQRPGPMNALGSIKFLFPNQHAVYLHDTPAQSAFEETRRAVSHGCVRVAEPMELADWVLAETEGWNRELVEASIGGENERIDLDETIPVLLYYLTAFSEDGEAHFREDIYGQDEILAAAMDESSPAEAASES